MKTGQWGCRRERRDGHKLPSNHKNCLLKYSTTTFRRFVLKKKQTKFYRGSKTPQKPTKLSLSEETIMFMESMASKGKGEKKSKSFEKKRFLPTVKSFIQFQKKFASSTCQ